MKSCINMPLKKALPLLFIGALVLVSTAGCDGTQKPTATPTVQKATVTVTATPKATTTPTVKATATKTPTATPTSRPSSTPSIFASITPTPKAVTPTTAPSGTCNCNGPDLDCANFATHAQAQACYDYCMAQTGRDVFRLDGDNDGIACEALP
jgi:hypothetical protein